MEGLVGTNDDTFLTFVGRINAICIHFERGKRMKQANEEEQVISYSQNQIPEQERVCISCSISSCSVFKTVVTHTRCRSNAYLCVKVGAEMQ